MDYYAIGQRIRKFRKAHSLSQEALAEKVGISTTHMSHIETGNTKLSLTVLVNLASMLEVSTDDILFDHTSVNKSTVFEQIFTILEKCDSQQLTVIMDVIQALQISLSKRFLKCQDTNISFITPVSPGECINIYNHSSTARSITANTAPYIAV